MRAPLLHRFEVLPSGVVISGGVLLVVVIAMLDFAIGWDLDLNLLYLLPVIAVAWHTGLGGALAIAMLAAVATLGAGLLGGYLTEHALQAPLTFVFDLLLFGCVAALADALNTERSTGQQLKVTDPLTGLATSDAFYEEADRQVKLAVRHQRPVTLAYIGVDNFNALNERFGHRTGDEVLVSIAQALRQHVRETDILARMAGDEFGVVFPETGSEAGRAAVEKVQGQLVEATEGWPISFSIGAITCDRAACTLDELIRRAEGLMRAVKLAGRNGLRTDVLVSASAADPAPATGGAPSGVSASPRRDSD